MICEYIAATEDQTDLGKIQTERAVESPYFFEKNLEFLGLLLYPWNYMNRFIPGYSAIKTRTNENSVFLISPVNPTSVLNDPVISTCYVFNTSRNSTCSVSRCVCTYIYWLYELLQVSKNTFRTLK